MMDFLYFPEDKSEYIPGLIMLGIFVLGAIVTMYYFVKKSKKDAKRFDEERQQGFEQVGKKEKH